VSFREDEAPKSFFNERERGEVNEETLIVTFLQAAEFIS
jgi:hypothetical protein